jgi:hypothetical protein
MFKTLEIPNQLGFAALTALSVALSACGKIDNTPEVIGNPETHTIETPGYPISERDVVYASIKGKHTSDGYALQAGEEDVEIKAMAKLSNPADSGELHGEIFSTDNNGAKTRDVAGYISPTEKTLEDGLHIKRAFLSLQQHCDSPMSNSPFERKLVMTAAIDSLKLFDEGSISVLATNSPKFALVSPTNTCSSVVWNTPSSPAIGEVTESKECKTNELKVTGPFDSFHYSAFNDLRRGFDLFANAINGIRYWPKNDSLVELTKSPKVSECVPLANMEVAFNQSTLPVGGLEYKKLLPTARNLFFVGLISEKSAKLIIKLQK